MLASDSAYASPFLMDLFSCRFVVGILIYSLDLSYNLAAVEIAYISI